MNTTVHMDHVILGGLIAGILFAILAFRSHRLVSRLFLAGLALCLLVPSGLLIVARNPGIVDARFRAFRFFYWDLGAGMSRKEVLSALAKWYPPGQESQTPRLVVDNGDTLEFVMMPDPTGIPVNERIILKMEAGLITGKKYLTDR